MGVEDSDYEFCGGTLTSNPVPGTGRQEIVVNLPQGETRPVSLEGFHGDPVDGVD